MLLPVPLRRLTLPTQKRPFYRLRSCVLGKVRREAREQREFPFVVLAEETPGEFTVPLLRLN
jgi:hypothetical protein